MGGTTIILAAHDALGLHVRRPRQSSSDNEWSIAEIGEKRKTMLLPDFKLKTVNKKQCHNNQNQKTNLHQHIKFEDIVLVIPGL